MILCGGGRKLAAAMSGLTRESPAKINLTLRVAGVRPDGFHELESLVARVGLCDTVTVSPRPDAKLTVECGDPEIPDDDRNLAVQAARCLSNAVGGSAGAHIAIEKRIPAGAGLGGGSSNAATVLLLLNELWELKLSAAELARIGAQVGSDVPLFLHGPLCIMRGRGEQVENVPQPLEAWAVLFLPTARCATAAVYQAWDRAAVQRARPTMDEILAGLDSLPRLRELLFNDLEEAALAVCPELGRLAERLRSLCGPQVRMTGSGSGFFHLTGSEQEARALAAGVTAAPGLAVRATWAPLPP